MPYIIEDLIQYTLTDEDAGRLERMEWITHDPAEHADGEYATTAYIWDDLGLTGNEAFDLLDRVLGRMKGERLARVSLVAQYVQLLDIGMAHTQTHLNIAWNKTNGEGEAGQAVNDALGCVKDARKHLADLKKRLPA